MGIFRKKPRVLVYYRVSKRAKKSVKMQKKFCNEFCANQKIKCVGEYSDIGFSGRTMNRPELKKLLRELISKKVDSVLVYKIDRLGRNFSDLNCIIDTLDENGVELMSATQNFNTSTPEGKFMLRMLMGLAEFESGMISKRTIDGLRAAGR
jgi:site-specific DNA recombinase